MKTQQTLNRYSLYDLGDESSVASLDEMNQYVRIRSNGSRQTHIKSTNNKQLRDFASEE